jgi:hypothetical protein
LNIFFKGGIFHGDDEVSQLAFRAAIDTINSKSSEFKFNPQIFNVSRTDSFAAKKIGKHRRKIYF